MTSIYADKEVRDKEVKRLTELSNNRLVRKGQKIKRVIVQMPICKGSIEERMYKSVNSKLKSIDEIMGD